ncbi:hypothetical protein SRABI80_04819 [Peribacillus frigoritolerans]|nr:hypothetical protein SRABI80_04819 [Peribacillus frigoritolerans]
MALMYAPEPGAPTDTFLPFKSSIDLIPLFAVVTI